MAASLNKPQIRNYKIWHNSRNIESATTQRHIVTCR